MRYSSNLRKGFLDVACERIPGLKSRFGQGAPDRGAGLLPTESAANNVVLSLRDCFDEIVFNNLGRKGKEVVLVKHLGTARSRNMKRPAAMNPASVGDAAVSAGRAALHGAADAAADAWRYRKPFTGLRYSTATTISTTLKNYRLERERRGAFGAGRNRANEVVGHCA